MSNPNTNALMSMLQNAVRADNGPTAAGFKTAYVGKDRFPIMILNMASIDDDAWKKSASFERLESSVKGKMDVHISSDLVTAIANDLPIDVTTAYMQSNLVKREVITNMTKVENLTGLAFLSSTGNTVKSLVSVAHKDRLPDITCVKLACILVGSTVDTRIDQNLIDV